DVFLDAPEGLKVGDLVSTSGDIDLLVDGEANLGGVTASFGTVKVVASTDTITHGNTGTGADVKAKNIELIATQGAIGTATDPVTIDLSASTTGTLKALAHGLVSLKGVMGVVRIDQVTSQTADVMLSAAGSILDGDSPDTTASDITGKNIHLESTSGSIGAS